jgi:hypothetical protein
MNGNKVRSTQLRVYKIVLGVLKRDAPEVEGLSRGEQPHYKRTIPDHFRLLSHLGTKRVGISWLNMLGINDGKWGSKSVGADSAYLDDAGLPLAFVG